MKIVILGGTGLIGTKTANILRKAGHDVVQSSPSTGVNTLTGEGLDAVLTGASVVIDVTNSPSFEPKAVLNFFETSGRTIAAAEKRAGVGHHVALSIVNTDRPPGNGYFHAKTAQEKVLKSSGMPYTIVRSTQFFEFVAACADDGTKDGAVRISPANTQFIAADDVAAAVAKAAQAAPQNATHDIAGPERMPFDKMVGQWLAAKKDPRPLVTDPEAPYFGTKIDNETLVPLGDAQLGTIRFSDWLAAHPAS
jgi:uncharacterized protein YbjT (DUF2867 family)